MSTDAEAEFNSFNEECTRIANKKHGNLAKMMQQKQSSRRMCNIGLLLSPLIVGIPLAWMECKRNALINQKLGNANMNWNATYQKCIRRKQRESQRNQ